MSKQTIVLIVLDGWGIGRADESNPIHVVKPANLSYIRANYLSGSLQASGISVGLPWGEEGNSEVGHLNIGAGKIMYQHFPKITIAIRNGSFSQNGVFKKSFEHARKNNSDIHFVGLLGSGNVHSSLEHLLALIKFAEGEKANYNLHLFSDGRDSQPNSVLLFLKEIPKEHLASLSGRFYAMDRDKHWERTQKTYDVLIGNGPIIPMEELESHVQKTYSQNLNDEYVEPTLIGPTKRFIKDNDAVIFFDFREDRMRQIVSSFILKDFNKFAAKNFNNLHVATMTQYDDTFKVPVAFLPEKAENPLGKILADAGKIQFRIAETQKYPHVTYFFNGLREEPFTNEYRVLVPSRPLLRQDDHPEMMTPEITNRLIEAVEEGMFNFILANFANPDMIAHTGNYEACLETVRIIDEMVGKIMGVSLKENSILIITSDHGNIERLYNPMTGEPETQHDPSPVPFYLVGREFQRQKTIAEIKEIEKVTVGILADVAPTILEIMRLPKPAEMTGQSLLRFLQ